MTCGYARLQAERKVIDDLQAEVRRLRGMLAESREAIAAEQAEARELQVQLRNAVKSKLAFQADHEYEQTLTRELHGKIHTLKTELAREKEAKEAAEARFDNASRPYALLRREEVLWQVVARGYVRLRVVCVR